MSRKTSLVFQRGREREREREFEEKVYIYLCSGRKEEDHEAKKDLQN